MRPLDPLDDSNSLSDLARSMHHIQLSPAQSAFNESALTHGPLVQLMHNISKTTGSAGPAATATDTAGDGADASEWEAVNHAATVSLAHPPGLDEQADSLPDADAGASMQQASGTVQRLVTPALSVSEQQGDNSAVSNMAGNSAQDFFRRRG